MSSLEDNNEVPSTKGKETVSETGSGQGGAGCVTWNGLVNFCKHGLLEKPEEQTVFETKAIDWKQLIHLARQHRVGPLVYHGITNSGRELVIPEWAILQLKNHALQQSVKSLNHARELIELATLFEKQGVSIIPYKGVVLSQEVYGDLALRQISDIDLLISLSDFERIREVLERRGYVPSLDMPKAFEPYFFRQNCEYNFDLYHGVERKFHVEPHWRIGTRLNQLHFGFNDLLPLTEKREFYNKEFRLFTPEGILITTCLHHGGKDRWNSIKHICDVAAILFRFQKKLDWELLMREVNRLRVTNIILLGVALAISTFDAPVPPNIRKQASSGKMIGLVNKTNLLLKAAEEQRTSNGFFTNLRYQFSLRKSALTKLKILYYHIVQLFSPTIFDILDQENADKRYWWLVLSKPFRIWRMHVRSKQRTNR